MLAGDANLDEAGSGETLVHEARSHDGDQGVPVDGEDVAAVADHRGEVSTKGTGSSSDGRVESLRYHQWLAIDPGTEL